MDTATHWPADAFEDAFRAHYRNLVRLVTPVTGEAAQAEEVAADALWKLHQHPELLAPGHRVGGWLYRTAVRLAIDRRRSRQRQQKTVELLARQPRAAREDPLTKLEQRERVAQVRRVLGRLRPAQARMLRLRHEGAPYREVAAAVGLQAGSVGTTLARAEAAFAAAWRKTKSFERQSI